MLHSATAIIGLTFGLLTTQLQPTRAVWNQRCVDYILQCNIDYTECRANDAHDPNCNINIAACNDNWIVCEIEVQEMYGQCTAACGMDTVCMQGCGDKMFDPPSLPASPPLPPSAARWELLHDRSDTTYVADSVASGFFRESETGFQYVWDFFGNFLASGPTSRSFTTLSALLVDTQFVPDVEQLIRFDVGQYTGDLSGNLVFAEFDNEEVYLKAVNNDYYGYQNAAVTFGMNTAGIQGGLVTPHATDPAAPPVASNEWALGVSFASGDTFEIHWINNAMIFRFKGIDQEMFPAGTFVRPFRMTASGGIDGDDSYISFRHQQII